MTSSNALLRRLVTVPSVIVGFAVVSALLPALVPLALLVDLGRAVGGNRSLMSLRCLAFGWVYLLGELWAIAALGVTTLLPGRAMEAATYRLQDLWTGWNMRAVEKIFSMEVVADGADAARPGPILVLSRHASLVDTLLPAQLIARPSGMRLRYVLKRELLADPALDIAGNRLPNAFVGRGSGDSRHDTRAINELTVGLGNSDGVLIYPEGTRFSEEKRARLASRRDRSGSDAPAPLNHVLPPRPGGTLALLEATDADVVVLAHHGLEGLATVADVWSGGLVGSVIEVKMWRISRSQIPVARPDRVQWLNDVWAEIDDWLAARVLSRR